MKMEMKERLDSWKEISVYISRKIRTCINWERELGLPVYRINQKSKRSRVFAYKAEIDRWFKEKANKQMHKKD